MWLQLQCTLLILVTNFSLNTLYKLVTVIFLMPRPMISLNRWKEKSKLFPCWYFYWYFSLHCGKSGLSSVNTFAVFQLIVLVFKLNCLKSVSLLSSFFSPDATGSCFQWNCSKSNCTLTNRHSYHLYDEHCSHNQLKKLHIFRDQNKTKP